MVMALITRITRLFKADVHAIIDSIEEPASLLKQSVREMEDFIAKDERQLVSLVDQQQGIKKSTEELNKLMEHDEEELDLCFEDKNEDLARSIIKRKLERKQYKKIQGNKLISLDEKIDELTKNLTENKLSLESMRQKEEILIDGSKVFNSDAQTLMADIHVSQDDIDVAMLRERKKRRQS